MRDRKSWPTAIVTLKDGDVLHLAVTSAVHAHVEAKDGFVYRGRAYKAAAHLYRQADGTWITISRLGDFYCPDATRAGGERIKAALIEGASAYLNSSAGLVVRTEGALADANNDIARFEAEREELLTKLRDVNEAMTRVKDAEANIISGVLPEAYVEGH